MDKAVKAKVLDELGGIPESVYDELVGDFVVQAKEQMMQIRSLLAKGERPQASAVIHSLKGCSANLRIAEVHALSHELEQAVKQGAADQELGPMLDKLESLIAGVTA